MKSFTDIPQSEKLAEILPIKSADMLQWFCLPKDFSINQHDTVSAWSLSALLNVLPSSTLDSSNDHYYRLRCMERFTEWHDNPIDACYEMILKLKEKNLL